jgi:hypothetical protein
MVMTCENCKHDNPESAEFCAICGNRLPVATRWPASRVLGLASVLVCVMGVAFVFFVMDRGYLQRGLSLLVVVSPYIVGAVLGAVALAKNARQNACASGLSSGGLSVNVLALFLTLVLYPPIAKWSEYWRMQDCQHNVRQLGTAVLLYAADYNNVLPSSKLISRKDRWDPQAFIKFSSTWNTHPSSQAAQQSTYPELLGRYMGHRYIVWCPSDFGKAGRPEGGPDRVSYYWKAALDYAWFQGVRKIDDSPHSSDQILIYENRDRHWPDNKSGLADGATVVCVFLDGHSESVRISNSGFNSAGEHPGPLAPAGEPAWFNCDTRTSRTSTARYWDPKRYCDRMR